MEETNAASLGIKKMFSVGLFKTINSLNSMETEVSLKFTVLSFKIVQMSFIINHLSAIINTFSLHEMFNCFKNLILLKNNNYIRQRVPSIFAKD